MFWEQEHEITKHITFKILNLRVQILGQDLTKQVLYISSLKLSPLLKNIRNNISFIVFLINSINILLSRSSEFGACSFPTTLAIREILPFQCKPIQISLALSSIEKSSPYTYLPQQKLRHWFSQCIMVSLLGCNLSHVLNNLSINAKLQYCDRNLMANVILSFMPHCLPH